MLKSRITYISFLICDLKTVYSSFWRFTGSKPLTINLFYFKVALNLFLIRLFSLLSNTYKHEIKQYKRVFGSIFRLKGIITCI